MRLVPIRLTPTLAFVTLTLLTGCGSAPETELAGGTQTEAAALPSTESPLAVGDYTADIGGRSIHYVVAGDGPPLMVLPNSWGLTVAGLQALFAGLEDNFTLVYFDPRGMGGSGPVVEESDMGMAAVRTDLDNLRRHLELDQVRVIGWSNGAQNLIFHAAEYPHTLSHAVFVHGVPRFSAEDSAEVMAAHPELTEAFGATYQELADETLSTEVKDARWKLFVVDTWFPEMFADPESGREMLRELFADTALSWEHNLYSNKEAAGGFDARERLGSITARSLVIAGAHDMMPPERVEEIHTGIADSEFVLFENSGHFAPVEEPERFVATVTTFLE